MIPTKYISAGPMAAQANTGRAMAAGQATADIGNAIAQTGEKGLEVVTRIRRMEEGGAINAFMSNADEEAGRFSIELARRSDTGAWPLEWKNKVTELQAKGRDLKLSPEGLAQLGERFSGWTSQRSINFETQAATKALGIAKAQTTQSLDYYAGRVDKDGFDRTLATARETGILNPAEESAAQLDFERQSSNADLDKLVEGNPQGVLDMPAERILEVLPGATVNSVNRAHRQAEAKIQERRGNEMDTLSGLLDLGELNPVDLEAAQYLTKHDRQSLAIALDQKHPPSNENHGKAWELLDTLRAAREDPAVTPEAYREMWNEGRASVLARVAPRWQGDLTKELSYLSPAGRSTDPGKTEGGYDRADLEAAGRGIATRAREAGMFGSVADDAPVPDREKAYRRFDDIRLAAKKFAHSEPAPTIDQVRDFTDNLISGDTAANAAKKVGPLLPGLRALPWLAPGSGGSSDALLPPKDPSRQLDNLLDQ